MSKHLPRGCVLSGCHGTLEHVGIAGLPIGELDTYHPQTCVRLEKCVRLIRSNRRIRSPKPCCGMWVQNDISAHLPELPTQQRTDVLPSCDFDREPASKPNQ